MNKAWHAAHALGRSATQSERVAWHRAHQKHCACRPIPASLVAQIRPGPAANRAARTAKSAKSLVQPSEIDRAFSKLRASFARDPSVTSGGKGFGANALKVNGKIFAMVSSKQEFVVKLPRERVAELARAGRGQYFDPGKGKLMKEWLAVGDAPASWLGLAREARWFVGR